MSHKRFAERLNHELDVIGLPETNNERVEAFAKMLKLQRFKAEALLNGMALPQEPLLSQLADELEVTVDWLLGSDNKNQP